MIFRNTLFAMFAIWIIAREKTPLSRPARHSVIHFEGLDNG
jgi:hypothetical protein